MKRIVTVVLAASVAAPVFAQTDARFYVGTEMGANLAPAVQFAGTGNDRASICDEYINPLYASVPGCTDPNRGAGDGWFADFDGTQGMMASAVVGMRLKRWLRLEAEYFFRSSTYAQTSQAGGIGGDADKLDNELRYGQERLGGVTDHNLYVNAYWDFPRSGSRATPYVGGGVGAGLASAEWGSLWSRHPDLDKIVTGTGQPNEDDIKENLAGTSSVVQALMTDTVLGFQLLTGIDFAVAPAVSMGVKVRWVRYAEFSDRIVSDLLRNHPPNLRLDGSEPVHATMSTPDFSVIGVTVGVKYHF